MFVALLKSSEMIGMFVDLMQQSYSQQTLNNRNYNVCIAFKKPCKKTLFELRET